MEVSNIGIVEQFVVLANLSFQHCLCKVKGCCYFSKRGDLMRPFVRFYEAQSLKAAAWITEQNRFNLGADPGNGIDLFFHFL